MYRMYDADDRCLYVGAAVNVGDRLIHHENTRQWGRQVARIDVTVHRSVKTACALEVEEIKRLSPIHNVDHAGAGRRMGHGELRQLIVDGLTERGPMTQTEIGRWLVDRGWPGDPTAISSVLRRALKEGRLVVTEMRPSIRGQHRQTRVYGISPELPTNEGE